jgi:hypothetical protein
MDRHPLIISATISSCPPVVTPIDHLFWWTTFKEHLEFFLDKTPCHETDLITTLQEYRALAEKQETAAQEGCIDQRGALLSAIDIRELKIKLLDLAVHGANSTGWTPDFYQHTIDEIEVYIALLKVEHFGASQKGAVLVKQENLGAVTMHYHPTKGHIDTRHPLVVKALMLNKVWLRDVEGHLLTVMHAIDSTEKCTKKKLKKEVCKTELVLKELYALCGYLKRGVVSEAKLLRATQSTLKRVHCYLDLFYELKELVEGNALLGDNTLTVKMLRHMIREEEHYLERIGELATIEQAKEMEQAEQAN